VRSARGDAPTPEPEIVAIEEILRAWFPPSYFVKAARLADHPLLPEEWPFVARAVARRRQEFATGRWLSREGLRSFALPDAPIGVGRLHEPLWPAGVSGAISHDADVCVVVLARWTPPEAASFGVDLASLVRRQEPVAELAPIFLANCAELDAMSAFGLDVDPALLLFSLKESIVKAISARVGEFLDLKALEICGIGRASHNGHIFRMEMRASATERFLLTAVREL